MAGTRPGGLRLECIQTRRLVIMFRFGKDWPHSIIKLLAQQDGLGREALDWSEVTLARLLFLSFYPILCAYLRIGPPLRRIQVGLGLGLVPTGTTGETRETSTHFYRDIQALCLLANIG